MTTTVRSSRKGIAATAAVVVLGLLAAVPAFACSALGGTISARPARGESGTTVQLTGANFQGNGNAITVLWGGNTGVQLATLNPDAAGNFALSFTVPTVEKSADPQFFQITAVQARNDSSNITNASLAFEVPADPALAAAKQQQQQASTPPPAPVSVSPVAPVAEQTQVNATTAQPTPATSAQAVAASRARTQAAPVAAVAAPVADPAPVAPAPVAAPVAPVSGPVLAETPAPAPVATGVEPLVVDDKAAMGGPRTIDSGTPLWMVFPLVLVGLTLFAGSSAIVIHEVRSRKERAKVNA